MNFAPLLALVGLAMWLRRKRECSAELCTCGCSVPEFNPYKIEGAGPLPPSPIMARFVPRRVEAPPPAVQAILRPYVPEDPGTGGSGGGGGTGTGGETGGGTGGGTGTGGGGEEHGSQTCFPEMCFPTWGGGQDWFTRYGREDLRELCCKDGLPRNR